MGMGLTAIRFFNRSISSTIGSIQGRRLAELGDQILWEIIREGEGGKRVWAKEWFEAQGCHHYSIDINGNYGSHRIDLGKLIEDEFWHENFDIVTNFGTAEHVYDQEQCWHNIHNFGRAGCVYVHTLPGRKMFDEGHCKYFYEEPFAREMSDRNGYTLIYNEYDQALRHFLVCYIKPRLSKWVSAE